MNNISLIYLLQLAWKRIWLLILALVIFAVAAFGYCKFFATKRYAATSSIVVTNGDFFTKEDADSSENPAGGVQSSDISASLSLTNTVTKLLQTSIAFDEFAQEYGDKYGNANGSYYKGIVSVSRDDNTNSFIMIRVGSTDPEMAKNIANDFAEFSCTYIKNNYFDIADIRISDKAKRAGQTEPRTVFTTGIAAVVGVLLMYLVVFIFDSLNQSIRGEEEFSMKFDVPVIGLVPDFTDTEVIDSYYSKKGVYSNAK